jgi:hypothetical protein
MDEDYVKVCEDCGHVHACLPREPDPVADERRKRARERMAAGIARLEAEGRMPPFLLTRPPGDIS